MKKRKDDNHEGTGGQLFAIFLIICLIIGAAYCFSCWTAKSSGPKVEVLNFKGRKYSLTECQRNMIPTRRDQVVPANVMESISRQLGPTKRITAGNPIYAGRNGERLYHEVYVDGKRQTLPVEKLTEGVFLITSVGR
jgi:hypothetical protein